METDRELLPVVEVRDREFLVDVKRREFRAFRDPNYRVYMHSEKGWEMVRAMAGTEWRSHGLDNLPVTSQAERCRECDRPTAKS